MATLVGRGAHARYRPIAVVEALDQLQGPASGVVHLPRHLDWGPRPDYDLGDRHRAVLLYCTVLQQSVAVEDLTPYLNGALLHRLWTELVLPDRIRDVWEKRFPDLVR